MGRLVVVGGLNMDIHLFGVREAVNGSTLVADHHLAEPGGRGANVARAAARLGVTTALVGRVGSDDFGQHCVEAVAGDGVDVSGVTVTRGQNTGFVAIDLEEGRHRSLVFSPGANDLLSWADVEPHVTDLTADDLVIAQAEVPPETLSQLATTLAAQGTPLFLDPAPAENVTPELLALAEVITPDLDEAAQLTGRSNSSPLWMAQAARELRAAGARRVLIKLSEHGALLLDEDGFRRIPTAHVEAADETGAGDVFIAALAAARLAGAAWEQAVRFANAASALSVSSVGLRLPDRTEVELVVPSLGETEPIDI